MKKLLVSIVALAAFGAAGANAATVSGGSFSFPEATTEIDQTGTLNLFNPALGIIHDVELTITASSTQSFTLFNHGGSNEHTAAMSFTDLYFSSSNAGINGLLPAQPQLHLTTGTGGVVPIAMGQTLSFGPTPVSGMFSVNLTAPPSDLSAFVGPGTFTIEGFSLSGINIAGGGGNIDSTQTTTAGIGASITYSYTPNVSTTPLPGSLVLFGSVIAGAGAFLRRRRGAANAANA